MPLTQEQFAQSLEVLFSPETDSNDPEQLVESAAAYQNLAMHFIEQFQPDMVENVAFDLIRMDQMLRRFYRDAFGVGQLDSFLEAAVENVTLSPEMAKQIREKLRGLSVRINSKLPRKTRVAAAFALWASTMRPLCVLAVPKLPSPRLQRLQATIDFWITTQYLETYGSIRMGVSEHDMKTRLRRIWHDFTCRALNLSSLEVMYAFIFEPRDEK
jgi:hypothetical protein